MFSTPLLFAFIIIFSVLFSDLEASSCNNVNYIRIDDARRSTANVYANNNSTKRTLCDRSIIQDDVWYRFSSEAGEEIPTTKPKVGSCGTWVPIWMNGSHPTVTEGIVSRKACANVPRKIPIGCGYSYNIKVRNCSGFYIYQLKRPSHCVFAYCAGSILPNCTNVDPKDYCLENRPPKINMPDRFYAFENSTFKLVINATDPEGYPLRYSYLENKTVSSVSIDHKQKLITVSVKNSGRFSLRVKDYGQVATIHTVEIVAIPCPCKNGGQCVSSRSFGLSQADLSNYTCNCHLAYTGKFCEVSPCDGIPCYPGVKCLVTDNGYECEKCPAGFYGDGRQCQLILSDGAVVVEAELTIVTGLRWNDDLLNKTSRFYKIQTAEIVSQISKVYSETREFLHVIVVKYSKGSVKVEFQVVLKEKLDNPLEPLKTRVKQNGKLGNFGIDTKSVKTEDTFEVDGELNVLSGLAWKKDLLKKSSLYYKDINGNMTTELNKLYADVKGFVSAFVTGFRKQNFVMEFKLIFRSKEKLKEESPLDKLKHETNGMLGNVKFDRDSVKEKKTTSSSDDSTYFGQHKVVFIVVVTLLSIFALIIIVMCAVCIRKKHISIVMLTVNDDDHHEIYPTGSNRDSTFHTKKPSHNQVIDLAPVKSTAW